MLEKTEGRRRRGQQDEMAEYHHQLNGHEFEQIPGDNEGQGAWHTTAHGVVKSWT